MRGGGIERRERGFGGTRFEEHRFATDEDLGDWAALGRARQRAAATGGPGSGPGAASASASASASAPDALSAPPKMILKRRTEEREEGGVKAEGDQGEEERRRRKEEALSKVLHHIQHQPPPPPPRPDPVPVPHRDVRPAPAAVSAASREHGKAEGEEGSSWHSKQTVRKVTILTKVRGRLLCYSPGALQYCLRCSGFAILLLPCARGTRAPAARTCQTDGRCERGREDARERKRRKQGERSAGDGVHVDVLTGTLSPFFPLPLSSPLPPSPPSFVPPSFC
jgi:hypothetical protein